MESNWRNMADIVLGISFGWLLKWKMYVIHPLSDSISMKVTVFFAGLFIFCLALHIVRLLLGYYRVHGLLSFGTVTAAAFVSYFGIVMLFAHSSADIFHYFLGVAVVWLFAMTTLSLLYRWLRRG